MECTDNSYFEFGHIRNATYDNIVYKKVHSYHNGKLDEHYDEMTAREALDTIIGLAEALKE